MNMEMTCRNHLLVERRAWVERRSGGEGDGKDWRGWDLDDDDDDNDETCRSIQDGKNVQI